MTCGFAVKRLEPAFHYTKDTLPGRMSRQVLLFVLSRVLIIVLPQLKLP